MVLKILFLGVFAEYGLEKAVFVLIIVAGLVMVDSVLFCCDGPVIVELLFNCCCCWLTNGLVMNTSSSLQT